MNNLYHHGNFIAYFICVMGVLSNRWCNESFIGYWIINWLRKIIPQSKYFNGVNFRKQFICWAYMGCMCNKASNSWSTICPRYKTCEINIWTSVWVFSRNCNSIRWWFNVCKVRYFILEHNCKLQVLIKFIKSGMNLTNIL